MTIASGAARELLRFGRGIGVAAKPDARRVGVSSTVHRPHEASRAAGGLGRGVAGVVDRHELDDSGVHEAAEGEGPRRAAARFFSHPGAGDQRHARRGNERAEETKRGASHGVLPYWQAVATEG